MQIITSEGKYLPHDYRTSDFITVSINKKSRETLYFPALI